MPRRQVAYEGYMGCGAMYNPGTNFLVVLATSNRRPLFLALNVETGVFCNLNH
jgi:hypothetical protein